MAYSPILGTPKPQFEDANGVPYVGMRLFFYVADSSTKLDTQTDSTGTVANTNPVVIGADGYPEGDVMIYGQNGNQYKIVAALPGSDDPPTSPLWTINKILCGVSQDEWINPLDAIYVSATQFTVAGDQTGLFHANRPIKLTGGADRYGFVSTSIYTTLTTVTVKELTDSSGATATLHASMDTAYVSFNSSDSTSAAVQFYPIKSGETSPLDLRYDIGHFYRYGITGDGTDETAKIQNAINYANQIKGVVPKGVYTHGSTLVINQHQTHIEGQILGSGDYIGEGCVLKKTGTTPGLIIGYNPSGDGTFLRSVSLKNLTLESDTNTGIALQIWMTNASVFENISVFGNNGAHYGVYLSGSIDTYFYRLRVRGDSEVVGVPASYLNYGLYMTNGFGGSPITTTFFNDCYFHYCNNGVATTSNATFKNCVFESNNNSGLVIGTNSTVRIENCWFEANIVQDVFFSGGSKTYFKNCHINAYTRQIFFSGATPTSIIFEDCNFSTSHASPIIFSTGSSFAGTRIEFINCVFPANCVIGGSGSTITYKNCKFVDMPVSVYRFAIEGVAISTTYQPLLIGSAGVSDAYLPEDGHILGTNIYYSAAITAGNWDAYLNVNGGAAITDFTQAATGDRQAQKLSKPLAHLVSAGDYITPNIHTDGSFAPTGGTFVFEVVIAHGDDGL